MLPDPLHPAVVHLPVALAVLIPLLAVLVLLAVRAGRLPRAAWAGVLLLQLLLVGTGWLALETGEDQEERVERVVAERHIETHEEAAERFLALAALGLPVAAAGLLAGSVGAAARLGTAAVALVVLAAGVQVGHSGGELVYTHGAASAYLESGAPGVASARTGRESPRDDDDD